MALPSTLRVTDPAASHGGSADRAGRRRPGRVARRPARRLLPPLIGALALLPVPAAAQLHLTWNDCVGGRTAAPAIAPICSPAPGAQALVAAFEVPQVTDSVIGIELVVDARFASASVPAWWALGPSGCRAGALSAASVPPVEGSCGDFWNQDLAASLLYLTGQSWQGASQARIAVGLALPGDQPARTLQPGTTYFAAVLGFADGLPAACGGCDIAACFVLNSVRLLRVPGTPGGDLDLSTPGTGNSNWATWQGTGADCSTVPVRGMTWGRLKTLYR